MDSCMQMANDLSTVKKIEIIGDKVFFDGIKMGRLIELTEDWFKMAYQLNIQDTKQEVEMKITFTEPIKINKYGQIPLGNQPQ